MSIRRLFPALFALCLPILASRDTIARDLTLEDRFRAQEAIERVYWAHRIWPPENRAPKPALESVFSRSQLRARVIDTLRKSKALAVIGNRPITAKDLQEEMRRMAATTRAPTLLKELFAALGNDPFVIAETLARQELADRLIREAGAGDARRLDAWLAGEGASAGENLAPVSDSIVAIEIDIDPGCVDDSWTDIPPGPAPFVGHTAVWTGTEMIIWGQYSGPYPATGGRYNPATNAWTATSGAGAPVTRYAHSAVWTGREMIVWGGHLNGVAYPGGYLNDGGRYDPTTDSWKSVSADGAPGVRESHTAIWTGTEMILWGGDTGYGTSNDGGRYDPSSDSWVGTSLVGAPESRAVHSAVWTGTEMIVWGGDTTSDGQGYMPVQTGGRYDPATDTWAPTPLENAPTARSRQTAVWTGTRMIIWGGGAFFYLNTGAMYDPVLDAWTPTSTSGALPEGRESHRAVWTGHEMIIWGGHQGGQPFDAHGGRYDPGLGTWLPMSHLSGLMPRELTTAVWTGSEMLVWRGFAGTTIGYAGAYCAPACNAATTLYRDRDDDGHGVGADAIQACPQPGYADKDDDCNDSDPRVHPGASEACNGADEDCNGLADDAEGAVDLDGDGIPGACDLCPAAADPSQADFDSDGEGDVCDLNDGRLMIRVPGPEEVDWDPEPTFTSFDVYRGDLDVLRATGESTQDPASVPLAARFCGRIESFLLDDPPPPGRGVFYLVAATTPSGYEGIGNDSDGNPRWNAHPCP